MCGHEATGELARAEVEFTAVLLLAAGHETSANQTAPGVLTLLRHLSVVQTSVGRVATWDVQLGDTLVRTGDGLFCILSTANRDPVPFADPDSLDLARDARRHVAVGFGVHQCRGQTLTRVELPVTF